VRVEPKTISIAAIMHNCWCYTTSSTLFAWQLQGFYGVLRTRFGSLEFQIGSLESEKIIIKSLKCEKIGALESEKSGPYRSILSTYHFPWKKLQTDLFLRIASCHESESWVTAQYLQPMTCRQNLGGKIDTTWTLWVVACN